MIINLANTLIGYEVDDWWLFYDANANKLVRETGLQLHKAAGGKLVAGFPIKDEAIYTAINRKSIHINGKNLYMSILFRTFVSRKKETITNKDLETEALLKGQKRTSNKRIKKP